VTAGKRILVWLPRFSHYQRENVLFKIFRIRIFALTLERRDLQQPPPLQIVLSRGEKVRESDLPRLP
jgi:cadmium resistance protein CadD (predicted permease)